VTTRGKTDIRSLKVEEILDWAKGGKLRLPTFQRKLRWEAKNVVELFDSIYNAYPIGTLLLARRPIEPAIARFGSVVVDPVPNADAHWIIDGQQRVTSLVAALLHPDLEPRHDQFAVYFELETEEFFIRRHRSVSPTAIPLRELRDTPRVLGWLRHWTLASERPELETKVYELSKAIREFTVACAIVEGGDDDLLRRIFVRTNRTGVAMMDSEVFDAIHGSTPAQSLASAAARLSSLSMGDVEANTLLRCAKHVAGLDPGERPEDLTEVDGRFVERAETALGRALTFISADCDLPHLSLLHQRFPLIPLTRYFDIFPQASSRARRLLRRWLWRGLVTGAFDQSGFGPTRQYQQLIDAGGRDEFVAHDLLKTVERVLPTLTLPETWTSRSLEVKLLVAMFLSRMDGEPYDQVLREIEASFGKAGHFLGDLKSPGAWMPTSFLSQLPMPSSLGFEDDSLAALNAGDFTKVVRLRQPVLERMLNDFVSERCETDLSDRPSIKEMVGAA
jgi:Protein of unknown function DUF262